MISEDFSFKKISNNNMRVFMYDFFKKLLQFYK